MGASHPERADERDREAITALVHKLVRPADSGS
jgi:hypothetical protein